MPKSNPKVVKLPPPDCHYLEAAVGWVELGNPSEALKELDLISVANQNCAQVLEVRWQVHARTESWDKSLPVAQEFCKAAPGLPQPWLHQAVSLYRLNRTEEAWNLLLPFAQKFPRSWVIPYDLACYACQLGKTDEGRRWLRKALDLGDSKEVKLLALADPDLKVLWPEIQSGRWEVSTEAEPTQ
jgi:tetratricopeptide (TPR) repeat protein